MRKLENLIKASLIIVCIASVLAIVSNFILVPQIKKHYEINRDVVDQISVTHAGLSLPVSVMRNIKGQVKPEAPEAMSEALKMAFEDNSKTLNKDLDRLNGLYDGLLDNLMLINQQTLGRHKKTVATMNTTIEQLKETLLVLEKIASSDHIVTMDAQGLAAYYSEQEAWIGKLVQEEKTLEMAMVKDITWIVNGVILVLILLMFLLGVVLLRYVKYDFSYMMKSLELLSNRQYDEEALPKAHPYFEEETQMVRFIKDIMAEKRFSNEINTLLMKYYLVDDVVEALFEKLRERLPIDRLGVAFVDHTHGKIVAEHGVICSGTIRLGPGFEVSIASTRLKDVIASGEPLIMDDLEAAYFRSPQSPSLALLRKEGMLSNMVIPLMMGDSVFGMVFFSSRQKAFFNRETLRIGKEIIGEIAPLMNRSYLTKMIFSKMTSSFSELVEGKDFSTGEHIHRMVTYSVLIAKGLSAQNLPGYQMSEKDILEIERNAASHDIGKVSIPDAILKKPGPLTPDEWQLMKTHAATGADIFKRLRESLTMFDPDFFKAAEEIARYHHEKWDGSGYPEGLKGNEIPLSARIVAIADVFDALTSKRVYKDAYGFEEAVQTIREGAGKHFDPVVVDVFVKQVDAIKRVYLS